MAHVLLVEDSESLRTVIKNLLERQGYKVSAFEAGEEALNALTLTNYDCMVSDFKLPKMNGIELLNKTRAINPNIPFLLMTAYGSVSIAVEAMKSGANDFLEKPFEPEVLLNVVSDLITHRQIIARASNRPARKEKCLITQDLKVAEVLRQASKVAKVLSSVLICGESGTGKELLARFIHEQSTRASKPFVAINCAAIPKELIESEFFGHEAGAFTGATQQRIGLLEYAAEGTVFLDEVGDMPQDLQVKLLRALQEQEIRRVGGNKLIKVAPRIVAATNKDIQQLLASGELREDFYYRLAVVDLKLPAIRERKGEAELLASHFVEYFSHLNGKSVPKFSKEAMALIKKYPWPGNARELENVMERAVILAEQVIQPEHLGLKFTESFELIKEASSSLQEISAMASRKAEIESISKVLGKTGGNKTKAAQMLGVSYKTLLHKVKEYSL